MSANCRDLLDKAQSGGRLTEEEALRLFREAALPDLGSAAHAVRMRLHPEPVCSYIVDRNINYTNVCIAGCRFCAFSRRPGHPEASVIDKEVLGRKIDELKAAGGRQVLLQGGLHPELRLKWYEDLLRFMKSHGAHVHGFSPPEICHIASLSRMSVRDVLVRLRAAGLDSIPGGGAEILVDRVRKEVSPAKLRTDAWLGVMEEAHALGMKTTATMVFGHVEARADRVEHLRRLRDLQDRTGGFTAFIPWSFQPDNTAMAGIPRSGGQEYLRTLAVSRLYLDSIPNLQASWVTQGSRVAQMALLFGANDMGSTMLEENVVRQAGAGYRMTEEEIRHVISDLGFLPRRRDTYYRLLEEST